LFALDEEHFVAGKKDGTLDLFNVKYGLLLKSYKLDLKSGVQSIARHSSKDYMFAIGTVQGLCFATIST
jgi:hypothetical protein